jgi:hypothetical protein
MLVSSFKLAVSVLDLAVGGVVTDGILLGCAGEQNMSRFYSGWFSIPSLQAFWWLASMALV